MTKKKQAENKKGKEEKMKKKIKAEKRIHNLYKEWVDGKKIFRKLVNKWHYIYSSDKGKISLVRLFNYFYKGYNFWEIYSLEGELFEDVERFNTKKEAEKQIEKYLK